jgi:hypothetical protein
MNLKITEIDYHKIISEDENIVILPINFFEQNSDKYFYPDNALSFFKFAKQKIDIKFFTEPDLLLTQQSGEWFAPILLVTSEFIVRNPACSSILYGLITSYIYDILRASKKKKDINLKVICHETKNQKWTEIHYQGSVDGIESITNAIIEVFKKE